MKTFTMCLIVVVFSMISFSSSAQTVTLKIYPNPVTNPWLNVDLKDTTITGYAALYDMVGQQLLYKPFKGGRFEMDLWNYGTGRPIEKGIYAVTIYTTGNKKIRLTGRFVKQ